MYFSSPPERLMFALGSWKTKYFGYSH